MQQIDSLLGPLDSLLPLPGAIVRILIGADGPDPIGPIIPELSADAALAGILLRLARQRRPEASVGTVEEAVEILGPGRACRAVVIKAAMKVFGPGRGALDHGAFWTHSLAVAIAAERLAERLGGTPTGLLAFFCGALHDVGKLALDACLPKSYARVLAALGPRMPNIAKAERDILGLDHTLAGRRVAQRWRLPGPIEEVIWLHHHSAAGEDPAPADARMVALIQLADTLARQQKLGFSGNDTFVPGRSQLAEQLSLPEQDASAIGEGLDRALRQWARPIAAAAAPEGSASATRTQSAPAPARGASPPSIEAASLEQQERLLNVLRDFPGRVGPVAGIGPLCLEIARAFCEAFPASGSDGPVGAFYISFESMQLLLCMCDRRGNVVSRAAGCRPGPVPRGRSVPAEDLLRPLLDPPDAWGDLIDLAGYTCLPLVAGQRWVGGVLTPRVPGDPDVLIRTFCEVMAFALAASADSAHADRLAERLARSNRRLAETREALAQAQAFAAIGEMAAGAAHELNNPLAVISGRAQLIAQKARTKEQKKAAEQIVEKAEEVSGIALELMDFAQPVAPSPAQVDVAELLAEVKNAATSQAQPKAPAPVVDIDVQTDCPPVWVDAGQVRDVLLELIGNACQAADGPVRIRLEAATESGSQHVLVQVSDDGPGMDEKVLASAFTPFFSHRPAGRRRGMGLPRARRCIQSHGGRMWIESRPGGGTTAFVTLPQAQREAPNR